jgi:hypothetical protein
VFAELIRLLIAAACALFVLSLPLSKTNAGATLRRWAGVCFILALLPSIIYGLLYPAATTSNTSTSSTTTSPSSTTTSPSSTTTSPSSTSLPAPADDFFSTLGCAAAVVIAAFVAYGVLKLRSRFLTKSKARDPWETFFNRGGGKRPFTMNANPRRSRGPFSFDDEEDD